MNKLKICNLFNITFPSFILTQMGGDKTTKDQTEKDYQEKLLIKAIKTSFNTNSKMIKLVMYIGHQTEYCIVFDTEQVINPDFSLKSVYVFWSHNGEISMVNQDWIDIWHLKNEYIELLANHKYKLDYTNQINEMIVAATHK
jgi:hypothetical protein